MTEEQQNVNQQKNQMEATHSYWKAPNNDLLVGDESEGHKIDVNKKSDSGTDRSGSNKKAGSALYNASAQENELNQDTEQKQALLEKEEKKTENVMEEQFPEDMSTFQCFWKVTTIATPVIFSMLVYLFVQLVNTFFIGHLNDPALLGGVGMGNMLINVLGMAIFMGMNGALETFVSKSFGQKKYKKCGVYLNRGKLIVTILMIPVIIIFFFSEKILIKIRQEPAVAHYARNYCCILIPGTWANGIFDASRKFLSSQFEVGIPLYTQLITLVIHIVICWLLVWHFNFREVGAAIATDITYILNMIICDTWCMTKPSLRKTFACPDLEMFKDLWAYFKIGFSGAMMLCFEWWAFELLAIFSGLLGVDQLAAEVITINIVTFIFMIPLGISYAASALTGYFLGRRDFARSRTYSNLAMLYNQLITVVIVLILGFGKSKIAVLFTTEPKVVTILEDIMLALVFYVFFDTLHGVQSGIIRGLGRQAYGSAWTLLCYWILGLPLALHYAFKKDQGVYGLWFGFAIACVILDVGFYVIIQTGFRTYEKSPHLITFTPSPAPATYESRKADKEQQLESLSPKLLPKPVLNQTGTSNN